MMYNLRIIFICYSFKSITYGFQQIITIKSVRTTEIQIF